MRSAVVLPAPFGPRSPVILPSSARKLTPPKRGHVPERLLDVVELDHGGGPAKLEKNA